MILDTDNPADLAALIAIVRGVVREEDETREDARYLASLPHAELQRIQKAKFDRARAAQKALLKQGRGHV